MADNKLDTVGEKHSVEKGHSMEERYSIEHWLSLEEIANHLGVSKETIRGWIKKGTIPNYKVGRQYKFKVSEVDAWIESGKSADADKAMIKEADNG